MECEQISVAGIQIAQFPGDRDANILAAREAIIAAAGHDIYVLPELSSSGYNIDVFRMLDRVSEELDGPSFQAFSDLARTRSCFICYSFPRRSGIDAYTICAAVVDTTGALVAHYDKWHVCSTGECCEKEFFIAGQGPLAAFDCNGFKVGLAICYDIRFPELTRNLVLHKDISLLLHPGGWPKDDGFHTWHMFVQVRAMENSIYIMSTNWAGSDNGHTAFCPPVIDGNKNTIISLGDPPGALSGIVRKAHLQDVRRTYPLLKDRRDSAYPSSGPSIGRL